MMNRLRASILDVLPNDILPSHSRDLEALEAYEVPLRTYMLLCAYTFFVHALEIQLMLQQPPNFLYVNPFGLKP